MGRSPATSRIGCRTPDHGADILGPGILAVRRHERPGLQRPAASDADPHPLAIPVYLVSAAATRCDLHPHLLVLVNQERLASDHDRRQAILPGAAPPTGARGPAEPQVVRPVKNSLGGEALLLPGAEPPGLLATPPNQRHEREGWPPRPESHSERSLAARWTGATLAAAGASESPCGLVSTVPEPLEPGGDPF